MFLLFFVSLLFLLSIFSNFFLTLSNISYYTFYLTNHLAVNRSGSSPLLNILFSLFYFLTSFISYQYSVLNSFTISFAFSKFSLPSQVSDSAMNSFHYTKYLFFPLICCLFRILLTFYFSFSLITTRANCFFLCPSTCPTYFCTLLTLTTRCIFTVLDSSNSTMFDDMTFFIL